MRTLENRIWCLITHRSLPQIIVHLVVGWTLLCCLFLYIWVIPPQKSSPFPQTSKMKAPIIRTANPPKPNLPCETVDAVYLWVNGSDPKVVADITATGRRVSTSRVRDYGILKYSFRSIQKNAPWIRNIILVTSGELPTWLNRTSERFLHVTHRELFSDPSTLPTFNSNAIETQLVNLPSSTAECIFYLNDDMFFYSPTSLSDFYDQEKDRHFLTFSGFRTPVAKEKLSNLWHYSVSITSNNLFNAYYYPELTGIDPKNRTELQHYYAGHTCYFYKRSIYNTLYQRWKVHYDRTAKGRYRLGSDVQIPFLYYNSVLKEYNAKVIKSANFYGTIVNNHTKNNKLFAKMRKLQPICVCLNDELGESASGPRYEQTIDFLEEEFTRLFPTPSRWEIGGSELKLKPERQSGWAGVKQVKQHWLLGVMVLLFFGEVAYCYSQCPPHRRKRRIIGPENL